MDLYGIWLLFTVLRIIFLQNSFSIKRSQKKQRKKERAIIPILWCVTNINFTYFILLSFPCFAIDIMVNVLRQNRNKPIKLSTYIRIGTLVSTWTFECYVFMASLMYNERTDWKLKEISMIYVALLRTIYHLKLSKVSAIIYLGTGTLACRIPLSHEENWKKREGIHIKRGNS